MTLSQSRVSAVTRKGEMEEFKINKAVRQGDALSATLFNLALEYVTKKINKNNLGAAGEQLIALLMMQ